MHTPTIRMRTALGLWLVLLSAASGAEKNDALAEATVGKHQGYAHSVAYSPDGKWLVSSGHQEGIVRVWDIATKKELHQLVGHADSGVLGVRFSPDGKLIATAGLEESLRLWDPTTGKELLRIAAPGHPYSLCFAPDGKTLASTGIDRLVRVWDVATGKELMQLSGHTGRVWSVSYSPDGKRMASADEVGTIRLWESATGKEVATLSGHRGGIIPVVFSPNGKLLLSGGVDEQIHVWDLSTGKELPALTGHKGLIHGLDFSPDGRYLVSCGWDDKTVRLWETATGKEVWGIEAHTASVGGVVFAPDGRSVASVGRDSAVRVWDITGRVKEGKFQAHQLKAKDLDTAWQALKGENPTKAHAAAWSLIASPKETVAYLKEQLRGESADPDAAKKIAALIQELGDQKFGVRDRASHLLGKMGRLAEPALRKALDTETSAEVRTRVKALLEKLEGYSIPPEVVPSIRAMMVLEQIGTTEARQLLKDLSGGQPGSWMAREAGESLQRLSTKLNSRRGE